jgi:hypothetical protein
LMPGWLLTIKNLSLIVLRKGWEGALRMLDGQRILWPMTRMLS